MQNPLDDTFLSKIEIRNIFLPKTETMTLKLLQKYQNFDPAITQLNSGHKYKTKLSKADIIILENKILLRYFQTLTIQQSTKTVLFRKSYSRNKSTLLTIRRDFNRTFHILLIQKGKQVQKKRIPVSFKISSFQIHHFGRKSYATIA